MRAGACALAHGGVAACGILAAVPSSTETGRLLHG
jgi:hypothetical protein